MRTVCVPPVGSLVVIVAGVVALAAMADEPVQITPLPAQQPIGKGKRPAAATQPKLTDEEALKKAQLDPEDGAKLIAYLKQRTLSDAERGKIAAIIERFGADDFEVRTKATQEIELFGPAAVGPLKAAQSNPDPEIAYRAGLALRKLETVPHSAVAAAAVRAVARLKPEGAAAALIGFLPLADDETVADVIRSALIALAVTNDNRAEPALLAALTDPTPLRRAAAYVALTEGGPPTERIRIKDAYPKLKEAVLKDPDPEAKFTGLWSLALTTRENEFLPELINLIPTVGRGRIWQIEDLLLQLAGEHPKDGRFLKTPESLVKARDAWLAWWKDKGRQLDFVAFEFKPRILGYTDVIEMDYRGYGQGRIVSYGPDMKERWRITNVNNPTDIRVTRDGHVYVVESNNNIVSLRTTTGTVLRSQNVFQQPLNLDLLPDGGLVVICRNNIFEFDKDFKQRWMYQRPNYDIMAGCRLPNGETLFVTNMFQGNNGFRLDDKGKELGDASKRYTFGRIQNLHTMHVLGDEKVLLCEFDKVAEYDLKTGKQIWKHSCNAPSSCQRLPNGNTLITLLNQNQVIEVDPSGEVVWDYQAKDGLRVGRAYRR